MSSTADRHTPAMPTLFADAELQERFDRHGFVVVPLLSGADLVSLTELYRSLEVPLGEHLHATVMLEDSGFRHQVSEEVIARLAGPLRRYLPEAEPLVGLFFLKPPGTKSEFGVHQDWSMVDERTSLAAKVWCPLQEVEVANGALHLMPGSHRMGPTWRGRKIPYTMRGIEREVTEGHLVPIPCKLGEAIIFDNRVIHWSPGNMSDIVRPAAAMYVTPRGAELFQYFLDPDGLLRRKRVNREFFEQMSVDEAGSDALEGTAVVPALMPRLHPPDLPPRAPAELAAVVGDG